MANVLMFDVSEHDSNITCLVALGSNPDAPEVLNDEGFKFGPALESVYPLLDITFAKLKFDDLMNCSLVSREWKRVASLQLKKRNQISWLLMERLRSTASSPVRSKSSANFQYSNFSTAFYLYNHKRFSLNKFVCAHMKNDLKRMKVKEYIADHLTSRYLKNYCYLSCSNISATNFVKSSKDGNSNNVFAAVFLPDIPGVRIKMFKCKPNDIKREIQSELKQGEVFRCVLAFTLDGKTTTLAISKLIASLNNVLRGYPKKIALGGGILDSVSINAASRVYLAKEVSFVGFLQDTSVTSCTFEAYSTVIQDYDKPVLRKKLEEFKNQIEYKSQSVLFKFTCCAKPFKDIEDEILMEFFPNSVLLGMDVNGEIGINTIEIGDPLGDEFYHGYTTVLVLITW